MMRGYPVECISRWYIWPWWPKLVERLATFFMTSTQSPDLLHMHLGSETHNSTHILSLRDQDLVRKSHSVSGPRNVQGAGFSYLLVSHACGALFQQARAHGMIVCNMSTCIYIYIYAWWSVCDTSVCCFVSCSRYDLLSVHCFWITMFLLMLALCDRQLHFFHCMSNGQRPDAFIWLFVQILLIKASLILLLCQIHGSPCG